MHDTILIIFILVYLGMVLGGLPFLKLDRTGVALLGAIALIGLEQLSVDEAARAIHLPTILLLFSFMVVSAQMRLGGFYDWITRRLAALPLGPGALLAGLIAVVGVLSALFSNDVVCLAMAPVLVDACQRRRLDPVPFLLALCCAANIGSAATLIGNPQNMLIGESLRLSFAGYAAMALPPVLLGLALTWAVLWPAARRAGRAERVGGGPPKPALAPAPAHVAPVTEALPPEAELPLDLWQSAKGLGVALGIVACFIWGPWPREVVALTGAGLLLMSQRFRSSRMLGLVDWELLVLFMGLFVVNHALQTTGLPAQLVAQLAALGWSLDEPGPLIGSTFVLSNLVSNVPAVMLMLPHATQPMAGPTLALVSTLAGNLVIVGSLANIIVVDAAARRGVHIGWPTHARVGLPLTLLTLASTAAYLALQA